MEREKEIKSQGARLDSTIDSGIFIPMAESLRLRGQYDGAIEVLKDGLGKRPDSLPGRLLLGRCYLEKGMVGQAKEELERVAGGIEECLPVYRLLSQVYLEEKDVEKALETLRKTLCFQAAEEAVSRKVTPLEMGLFHRDSHPPFAPPPAPLTTPVALPREPGREGRIIEEKEPKAAIQTDTLAEIYVQQGRPDRALSVYLEILGRDPQNAPVREKYESLKRRMEMDRSARVRKEVQGKLEKWLAAVSSKESGTPSLLHENEIVS